MTTVQLLRLDPDLGASLPEGRRSVAARAAVARAVEIPRGSWVGDELDTSSSGFGLLVLSGILCRRVVQSQCYGAELIGPGDLMRPWDRIGEWSTIPTESSWTVIEPARVAILDAEFSRRTAPFPELAVAMMQRSLMRSRYLAMLIAIVSQRRIETRLTMLFWHLADRFGQRRGEWVHVPVPLTHSLLGELVAARRPSVTTALSGLQRRGIVHREADGWRLSATASPERAAVGEESLPPTIHPRTPQSRAQPLQAEGAGASHDTVH
ncbi:MAG TPA: Crp/Fnr family transcriptional regulator [Solirubrobacterales bacterium]